MELKRTLALTCTILLMISALLVGCNRSTSASDSLSPNEKFTLTVLRSEHPSQPLRSDAPSLQQTEKVTGVKIDLQSVPQSDYDTKKNTLLATNRIPDVMAVNFSDVQKYASSGMFLDITPYMDKLPNFKKALENYPEINRVMVDGKLYGFPNLDRTIMYYGQLPLIRADILKELNLPMPTSFEELYQTLKKMKQVYPNTFPWTMRNQITGNIGYLGYAFGTGYSIYYEPETDKYQYGPLYPEFKNMLAYFKKLYDEKLLDPNYATNSAQQWQESLSSGKSMFMYDNNIFGVNFNTALRQRNPNAYFEMIPVLKNDDGRKRNYMYQFGHLSSFMAISSKVKNPEKVVKFFDWLYSEEGADITNYGIPGEHFTRTKEGVKMNPELVEQFKDKQEPTWALLTYLGTGIQGFGVYVDETVFTDTSPDMVKWGELVKKQADQGIIVAPPVTPPFTAEETDKLKQIQTKTNTIAAQNLDKFIMGDRPLNTYDNFVKELIDSGARDIEKIYNTAYERVKIKK